MKLDVAKAVADCKQRVSIVRDVASRIKVRPASFDAALYAVLDNMVEGLYRDVEDALGRLVRKFHAYAVVEVWGKTPVEGSPEGYCWPDMVRVSLRGERLDVPLSEATEAHLSDVLEDLARMVAARDGEPRNRNV